MNPMCSPAHPGRLIVAPLWPRAVQARLVTANAAKPIIASALKADLVGTEQVVAIGKKRLRVFY
jgi:hypothetical protein